MKNLIAMHPGSQSSRIPAVVHNGCNNQRVRFDFKNDIGRK
ncbi:MAG: hypothetical protein WC959_09090 [Kiritimatiellales bacterium]